MDLFESRRFAQFRWRVTQNLFVGRTVVQPPARHIDQSNHVGGILGYDLEQLFVFPGFSMDLVDTSLLVDHQNSQRAQRDPEPLQKHAEFSLGLYRRERRQVEWEGGQGGARRQSMGPAPL